MARSARNTFLTVGGIALVVVGAMLLTDRVIGPVFAPLGRIIEAVSVVAWPMALILTGIVLITASRDTGSSTKLYRSRTDRVVGGVLGGISARMGVPATLVRVTFVVLAVLTSSVAALIAYVLALAFLPEEPVSAQVGYAAPPPAPPVPAAPAPVAPPIPESGSPVAS